MLLVFLVAVAGASAGYTPFNYGAGPARSWFPAAKLGMFVHWGPVSQWGTEISFPLVCESLPCTVAGPNKSSISITTLAELAAHRQSYADLAKTFNPVDFDPDAMALLAKQAGFTYMVYTTVHCDGFMNWPTNLTAYNIMNTPFQRDVFGLLATAFRKQGLKVGAYVCPSFWNTDSYWAPSALTALGPVCAPNYSPDSEPVLWDNFVTLLHKVVTELAVNYQPDLWWFDCANSPPMTDTRLEQVLGTLRESKPDTLVLTRNGIFSDYFETNDQSEDLANDILGQQQMNAGTQFEVPTVLQSSHQWAFDPTSGQKSADLILSNQILLNAKGGNYLVNVAPSPQGVWAPGAVTVLQQMAAWTAVNGEAVAGTVPVYPFQFDDVFVMAKPQTLYVFLPSVPPTVAATADAHPPTSSYQRLMAGASTLTLPWMRQQLLADNLTAVSVLGGGPVAFAFSTGGLVLSNVTVPPSLAPLRSYWSVANKDTAPCATRDCTIYTADAYTLVRVEGVCPTSAPAEEPATPLSLIFNSELIDNALGNATWDPQNYAVVDTECFAYVTPGPNRIPLDIYWNDAFHDLWALAAPESRAQAIASNYSYVTTLGYILSADTPVSFVGPLVLKFTFD